MKPHRGPALHRVGSLRPGVLPSRTPPPSARDEAVRYWMTELIHVAVGPPTTIIGPTMVVPGLPAVDALRSPIRRDRVQVSTSIVQVAGAALPPITIAIELLAAPIAAGSVGAVPVAFLGPPGRTGPGVSQVVDAMPSQAMRAEIECPAAGAVAVLLLTYSATWLPVATSESGDA